MAPLADGRARATVTDRHSNLGDPPLCRSADPVFASCSVRVALAFNTALYIDCVRYGQLPAGEFLLAVAEAFMRLMPLCPLLSVLIGASFLVVAQACEALDLPTAWLNWPIYYCTLYGPFAFVYVSVKAAARTHKLLPL